jgi:hypothetical protein
MIRLAVEPEALSEEELEFAGFDAKRVDNPYLLKIL